MTQMVKNQPTVQETQARSLGWEDPLEEEMSTHSSILAWRIPWARSLGATVFLPGEFHGQRSLMGYSLWGRKE